MKINLKIFVFAAMILCGTTVYAQTYSKGTVYSSGSTIYRDGRELSDHQIRLLFSSTANPKAYSLYSSAQSISWIPTAGYALGGTGAVIGIITGASFSGSADEEGKQIATTGWTVAGVSAGLILVGAVANVVKVSLIKKSVSLYNKDQLYSYVPLELNFGMTQNGVGLTLKF